MFRVMEESNEDSILQKASCKDFVFRRVVVDDYAIGFPEVLNNLTEVGTVSQL